MGGGECVRFVGLDLGAVCAPEVRVQRAKEVRLLRVHVDRRSFVLGHAVGIGGGQVPEVQQRSESDDLSCASGKQQRGQRLRRPVGTSMSPSSMASRSTEQPRQACIMESMSGMSAALLRPMMGTKEVDSWSTLSTRLA